MPAPASYARESDCKDTLKKVIINILTMFFASLPNIFFLRNLSLNITSTFMGSIMRYNFSQEYNKKPPNTTLDGFFITHKSYSPLASKMGRPASVGM